MSRRLVDEDDLSDQRLYTDEEIHVFYGQLVERLKAEGVYREDEDESKEKTHAGKNRYNKVVPAASESKDRRICHCMFSWRVSCKYDKRNKQELCCKNHYILI